MAPLFGLVKDLQLGKSRGALQLRLVRSYDVLQFQNNNEVSTHDCIFHDKEGDRIHASIQKTAISMMKSILKQGDVYAIMNFIVVENNMKFKTTSCRYKLMFFKHTRVTQLEDDEFPYQNSNFKSFADVALIENFQSVTMFDVIGVIVARPQIKEYDERNNKLVEIKIEDLEKEILACTLWEKYADQLIDFLRAEPKEPVCIILKFCRATSFRGEVRIASAYHATEIVIDESIEEIKEMSEKFITINKDRKTSLQILTSPKARTIEDEIEDGESTFKTISELKTAKDGSFWIYGTIYEVKTIMGWAYLACKNCLSKLKKDDEKFFCNKCQSFEVSGRLRYRLRVSIIDTSGSAAFILWDRECVQLIGKTATDLSIEYGGYDIPFEVDLVTDKSALFKINIKPGETIMNDNAYAVTKVNCDQDIIAKFSQTTAETLFNDKEIAEIATIKNMEGGSSDNLNAASKNTDLNATELVNLSDDESMKKRSIEENAPNVMKKKGKRVSIKKEKD